GDDATADLARGGQLMADVTSVAANHPFVLLLGCELDDLRARAAVGRRADPHPALRAADDALARLRAPGGPPVETLQRLAPTSRWRGAAARGTAARAALADGIAAAT